MVATISENMLLIIKSNQWHDPSKSRLMLNKSLILVCLVCLVYLVHSVSRSNVILHQFYAKLKQQQQQQQQVNQVVVAHTLLLYSELLGFY